MKQIDRIRSMNAEKLARVICKPNCSYCICKKYCDNHFGDGLAEDKCKAWLESEVDE